MNYKIIILSISITAIFCLGTFFYYYQDAIFDIYYRISQELRHPENLSIDKLISETERQISAPPPLRKAEGAPKAWLTKAGVLKWTNNQRDNYNLPLLAENPKLNLAAAIKAQDMLEKQYFAHESPTGKGPAELAEQAGYEFIAIGENLALGNFKNDEELVQEWMNSPGHRENILSPVYTEIGIAVIQGSFEEKKVWLAVQEFGKPLSACPRINEGLKIEIENHEKQISVLEKTLIAKERELQNIRPKRSPTYQQAVEEYNQLVEQYNQLVLKTKNLINLYNAQVQKFNKCLIQ